MRLLFALAFLAVLAIACTTVTVQVGTENSNDDSVKARRSIERNTSKNPE